jgi:PAS domain S-box-containing protein
MNSRLRVIERENTGRRRAEQALRDSEENYRILVDGVEDHAIFMVDAHGRIVSWNKGAERIKGYRAAEIIGQNFSCFFPAEEIERGRPAEVLRLAALNGRHAEQSMRVRKDGSRFLANVTFTALRDAAGNLQGFSEFSHDLSESAASEARYRGLLEAAPDAMVVVNQSSEIVLLNAQAEKQFGYHRDELVGQPLKNIVPQGLAERLLAHALRSPAEMAQKIGAGIELSGRRKDGSAFPIEIMLSPLESVEGVLVTAAIRDITARKQAEAQLLRKVEELNALNGELGQFANAAAAANKELEAFAYSVSHDLRAPLRSLDGFSQVLLEDYGDKLDEEGRDSLNRIRTASQRMGFLIDDMLALSQVTRRELSATNVDMSEIAADIVAELRQGAPGRHVEFVAAAGLIASTDRHLIRIALENLLGNAWKFTGKRCDPEIEFGTCERHGKHVYFVRDNGVGFDMAYAGKLFGAFQRMHRDDEFPGTGIGLATVQRVMHRLGGQIWAEAAPDRGATFYFLLDPGGDTSMRNAPI